MNTCKYCERPVTAGGWCGCAGSLASKCDRLEADRKALDAVLRNLMAKYKVRSEANIVHYDIGALAAPEWREAVEVVKMLAATPEA